MREREISARDRKSIFLTADKWSNENIIISRLVGIREAGELSSFSRLFFEYLRDFSIFNI